MGCMVYWIWWCACWYSFRLLPHGKFDFIFNESVLRAVPHIAGKYILYMNNVAYCYSMNEIGQLHDRWPEWEKERKFIMKLNIVHYSYQQRRQQQQEQLATKIHCVRSWAFCRLFFKINKRRMDKNTSAQPKLTAHSNIAEPGRGEKVAATPLRDCVMVHWSWAYCAV